MRKTATSQPNNHLLVQAISGTHVITLGINLTQTECVGLRGFAIERKEGDNGIWKPLEGMKVFRQIEPQPAAGKTFDTNVHPIQDFNWSDFTVRPGRNYTYKIKAMKGQIGQLTAAHQVEVPIRTESDSMQFKHNVFFNRGVAGSQAFTRKFDPENKLSFDTIAKTKIWVWEWLSRGLKEALDEFIRLAKDEQYALRAAVYEFQFEPILIEFLKASQRGVDVKIVYDAMNEDDVDGDTKIKNQTAIKNTGIGNLVIMRTKSGDIPHNKFILLMKNDKPIAVWTGSTNLTTGGIYGHSNVGHLVRDKTLAGKYLHYWNALAQDPTSEVLRSKTKDITPDTIFTAEPLDGALDVIFSPRPNYAALDWYAELLGKSAAPVFITFPFNVNSRFVNALKANEKRLFYVLSNSKRSELENEPKIKQNKFNRIASGAMLDAENKLLGWLRERLTGLNGIAYIHSKYLCVDPLGKSPLIISGTANFSPNSSNNNDENMLVIKGDKRVADIYFSEFMRIFRHFYFRSVAKDFSSGSRTDRIFLNEDEQWWQECFDADSPRYAERKYFSGDLSTS